VRYRSMLVNADYKTSRVGMRDLRIDFFRGLALYMILVDHVAGDPLARLTYRVFGFSDAAEIFVFLSGLACGIAYLRVLAHQGWSALILTIAKRAWRIYVYYVLSSGAIILLVTAAAVFWKIDYEVVEGSVGIAVQHPFTAMWSALLLISPPPASGILVLYIILTLFVVPAFLIAGVRHGVLALATSGLIWVGSQILSDFMAPLTHRWWLNPFAWQFLFSIGIFVGMKWHSKQPILPSLTQFGWVVVAAWTIVISAFLYKLVIGSRFGFDVTWLRIDENILVNMKENLSAVRLLHFVSVAVIAAIYLRGDSTLFKWPISMLVIKTGSRSLEVFSLIVVLDMVENIAVLVGYSSLLNRLFMDGIAFLLIAFTAIAITHRRQDDGTHPVKARG
jgi:hypothetical protein